MKTTREITSKKNKARYLIIVKGLSQKEAGEIVGVSQKTLTKWSKVYKWKNEETKLAIKQGGLQFFMENFFGHLNRRLPGVVDSVKKEWHLFLKSVEQNFDG